MERVRSEREKNIRKLRNGDKDFNGLAREILFTAIQDKSLSPQELVLPRSSPSSSSSLILSQDEYSKRNPERTVNYCNHYEIAADMECLHSSLSSNHHVLCDIDDELLQLLMAQVADELKSEYYSDTNNKQLSQFECDEEVENYNLSHLEDEADDSRFIICPVCR